MQLIQRKEKTKALNSHTYSEIPASDKNPKINNNPEQI